MECNLAASLEAGQAPALYDWEEAVFRANRDAEEFSLAECQNWITKIWSGANRRGPPPRVKDGRGASAARTDGRFTIHLPRWARNSLIILHEMAHCLTADQDDSWEHGKLFMATYLALLDTYTLYDHAKLYESARAAGLEVAERTGLSLISRKLS
jgi:hypothetical protein